jgi:hypothetical protein
MVAALILTAGRRGQRGAAWKTGRCFFAAIVTDRIAGDGGRNGPMDAQRLALYSNIAALPYFSAGLALGVSRSFSFSRSFSSSI